MFSRKTKPTKINSLDELKPLIQSGQPVLLDFFQVNCGPCKVMDGVVNELAHEYRDTAHVVKIDVTKVPGAAQSFGVRSTPTFVLLGTASKSSKKQRRKAAAKDGTAPVATPSGRVTPRWRAAGLVKKDQLAKVLESNGAVLAGQ